MRPGHRIRLVLRVPFDALTLMVGWQQGHWARKNTIPVILGGYLLEGGRGEHEEKPDDPR